MKILGLETYYGGSHRAFLDGWVAESRHEWTLLTLPAHKWKWRMRHSAINFAEEVNGLAKKAKKWDAVFCSDMLNLAEFKGMAGGDVAKIPAVVYFHENQLTYPCRFETERDYQFAMTNITTALAADFVWFNSEFHRSEFLGAIDGFFKRMNDNQPVGTAEKIMKKSAIYPPGITAFPRRGGRKTGPMRILWAGRWEHDKNPDDFFAALKILKESGCDFRLDCIGQQFRDGPECFAPARDYFADNIDRWGYQEKRADYDKILCNADVFISTANHEFFGISAAEAIAAGAYPLLPKRLAYPEILRGIQNTSCDFFYDGSTKQLAEKLKELSQRIEKEDLWRGQAGCGQLAMRMFGWAIRARIMDNDIEDIAGSPPARG